MLYFSRDIIFSFLTTTTKRYEKKMPKKKLSPPTTGLKLLFYLFLFMNRFSVGECFLFNKTQKIFQIFQSIQNFAIDNDLRTQMQ